MAKRYFIEPIERKGNMIYCPKDKKIVSIIPVCHGEFPHRCPYFHGGSKDNIGLFVRCDYDNTDSGSVLSTS